MFTPQEENRIKELIREVIREQKTNNLDNSALEFFKTIPDIHNHYAGMVYEMYEDFCEKHNMTPLSKHAFGSSVKKYYNVKSKVTTFENKPVRIYTR